MTILAMILIALGGLFGFGGILLSANRSQPGDAQLSLGMVLIGFTLVAIGIVAMQEAVAFRAVAGVG